jgi:membrane protease YdiL (CAAX protease family)
MTDPTIPLPEPLSPPRPARLARTGLCLAVLLIIACVCFAVKQGGGRQLPMEGEIQPNPMTNIMARYMVGTREFLRVAPGWNAQSARQLTQGIKSQVDGALDEFRLELLCSVLEERWTDPKLMASLEQRDHNLRDDVAFVGALSSRPEVTAADWDWLERRHGWVARLTRVQATDWVPAEWNQLKTEAQATVLTMGMAALLGFVAFIAGTVLLVRIIYLWRKGRLAVPLQGIETGQAHAFIEAFAIYLCGYTFVLYLIAWLFPSLPSPAFYGIALIFVIVAVVWPRWRGVSAGTWCETMGWHRGCGVFREMGIGVLGWLCGMPLLVAAAAVAPIIARWTGAEATHPMVQEMMEPGIGRWGLVALAVVWAPLVEEAMFRGLLFPGLSAGKRWLLGAVASAFVFAVVHPQGWAGVPAIMVIAGVFSSLRLLRGSLIASMTAHAINNGLVSLMLWFAV